MTETILCAIIGIIGTILGTIIGWLLNGLSQRGKLKMVLPINTFI